jgi:hypothetical protein
MTLTELLPMVRQLSAPDKLKLIRILAEELDTNDDISPYDSFGAGEILMQAMQVSNRNGE